MQLGTLLPLGDIGGDPATVREYAQAAESIGYNFVEAPDHVLGASEASAPRARTHRGRAVPRPVCAVRFSRRLHRQARLLDRRA